MTKINDGGPAFPVGSRDSYAHPGLTLRDWFAGQALASMETTTEGDMSGPPHNPSFWYPPDVLARRAYAIADAMIAERERGK